MNDNTHIPVLIVGGGPAGIAAALTLTARNIEYVIADAKETSSDKPGECVPPNALPLFRKLGLAGLLQHQGHAFYHGNQSVWGTGKTEEKLFLFEKHTKGLLLNRPVFEEQLRELAIKGGAQWLNGYSLHSLEREDKKLKVVLRSKTKGIQLYCDYIVDATGRKSSVCRKLGVEKETLDELTALDFKCKTKRRVPSYIHTESFDKGWFYAAPAGTNHLTVMLFTDPGGLPGKTDHEKFICESIEKTTLIKQLLPEKIRITELKVRAANSTAIEKPYGDNWLAVGDAAYSYDPVSSYGITSALAGGYYGAHALADAISGKKDALQVYHFLMENAFRDYRIKLQNHYSLEKRWPENIFWQKRMAGSYFL